MKIVTVCMGCYNVTINNTPTINSINTITKLMLMAKFTPDMISIEKYVCHECRISFSKKYCDKILSS